MPSTTPCCSRNSEQLTRTWGTEPVHGKQCTFNHLQEPPPGSLLNGKRQKSSRNVPGFGVLELAPPFLWANWQLVNAALFFHINWFGQLKWKKNNITNSSETHLLICCIKSIKKVKTWGYFKVTYLKASACAFEKRCLYRRSTQSTWIGAAFIIHLSEWVSKCCTI